MLGLQALFITKPCKTQLRVPSNYHIDQGERWDRIDGETAARCGPPSTDDHYLPRMFAEVLSAICPAARHG